MNTSRFSNIKVILSDIDGVLTDGKIRLLGEDQEIKSFCARDNNTMIALASLAGVSVFLTTGRDGKSVRRRAKELNVDLILKKELCSHPERFTGVIKDRFKCKPDEVLFIGDDLGDLYFLKNSGLAITPADALPEAKKIAHYITKAKGGEGVLAEIIQKILESKNLWSKEIDAMTLNPLPNFIN